MIAVQKKEKPIIQFCRFYILRRKVDSAWGSRMTKQDNNSPLLSEEKPFFCPNFWINNVT